MCFWYCKLFWSHDCIDDFHSVFLLNHNQFLTRFYHEWCCWYFMFWHYFFSHSSVVVIILIHVFTDFCVWLCRILHFLTWYLFLSQWKHNFFFWHSCLNISVFQLLIYFQFIDCSWSFFLSLLWSCCFSQEFLFFFFCCLSYKQLSIHTIIFIILFRSSDHSIFTNSFLTLSFNSW